MQHRTGTAQEDHHIGGPHRPQPIPLLHHQRGIQQRPDPPGGEARLQQVFAVLLPLLVPQEGQIHSVQLQGIGILLGELREPLPRHQGLVAGIVQLAKVLGHDAPEQVVAPLQHLRAGTEIPGQRPPPGLSLLRLIPIGIGAVFPQEDRGVGQAETVDRLLHIPYLEELPPPVGDRVEDHVLDLVGVLILVHQHLVIPAAPVPGQLCGGPVPVCEELHRKVLQIGEVQQPPPGLFPGKGGLEVQHQVHQGLHRRPGQGQLLQLGGGVFGKGLRRRVQDLFAPLADRLHPLPRQARLLLLERAERQRPLLLPPCRREGDGQTGTDTVPGCLPQELLQPLERSGDGRGVVGLEQLVCSAQRQRLEEPVPAGPGLPPDILQQEGAPGGLGQVRYPLQGPDGLLLLQPPGGRRVALHLDEDPLRYLGQAAVVPAGGEGVHQDGEGTALGQPLIPRIQHLLQHLGHEDTALPLVAQTEVRVQVQQVAALPEESGAEGVDRGDLRLIHQGGLAAEMAVVGGHGQPVGQLLGDPPPELRRRRLGEGDHQEAVDVQPLLGHPVQQPLHQHPGLPRPRRRRHQQLPAPIVYDLSLFVCQRKGHDCRLLCFFPLSPYNDQLIALKDYQVMYIRIFFQYGLRLFSGTRFRTASYPGVYCRIRSLTIRSCITFRHVLIDLPLPILIKIETKVIRYFLLDLFCRDTRRI